MQELKIKLFLAFALLLSVVSFARSDTWSSKDGVLLTRLHDGHYSCERRVSGSSLAAERGVIFTIVLIIVGVGSVAYALSAGARIILEGEFQQVFGRKRLEKRLRELNNHYIVCGYGRRARSFAVN